MWIITLLGLVLAVLGVFGLIDLLHMTQNQSVGLIILGVVLLIAGLVADRRNL